jgi:hypothetical protein
MIVTRHTLADQEAAKKIKSTKFEIDSSEGADLANIWLYEVEGGDTRVVVIPFRKQMIDLRDIKDEAEADKKEEEAQYLKEKKMNGSDRDASRKEWDQMRAARFRERCLTSAEKHLWMFKVEAFLSTLLEQTDLVSLCCLAEISGRRLKTVEDYQKEFKELFKVPADFQPQFVLHSVMEKRTNVVAEAKKEAYGTVFSANKNVFKIERISVQESIYYFSPQGISTKIYQNIVDTSNNSMLLVSQEFTSGWSRVVTDACLAFSSVIRPISAFLSSDKANTNNNDPNASFDAGKESPSFTFKECFGRFGISELYLPNKVPLRPFYTAERLSKISKADSSEPLVPSSIESLLSLDFFCKLSRDFLDGYAKKIVDCKSS